MKKSYIYIITNKTNNVLYTGMTAHLIERMESHKTKKYHNSFAARYNCDKLVYIEEFNDINQAYAREKQIKAGSRAKKIKLIQSTNPEWKDLSINLKQTK
jgi:putative endonuclease